MSTMKNLIMFYDKQETFQAELEDVPVLTDRDLKPHEVLIKVRVAGSNPKDWKHPIPKYFNNRLNQGDDCAGTIAAVGRSVRSFFVGERVAGFHVMDTPHGTYAEYAICPANTIFRIPAEMSDEEAATIPLTLYTAAVGLYRNLQLPAPWDRSDERAAEEAKIALVVNAGSSAVGAFAIKLAKLNPKIGPIITTAGSSQDFVKSLGVDAVVDYRSPHVAEDIRKAANGAKITRVFDAANSLGSVKYLAAVLEPKEGRYVSTMPITGSPAYPAGGEMAKVLNGVPVWSEQIWVGDVHGQTKMGGQPAEVGGELFGAVISRVVEELLAEGKLSGHPYEVVEGGLDGTGAAVLQLRDGRKKGGNTKFVTRIAETKGVKA